MIKIKNLSKKFDQKAVLSDINASFGKGKIYGIVGKNGSGKTTFFRCIAGLENFEGEVSCSDTALKGQLGYLMAEPYFLPKTTGEEYITLLTEARGRRIKDLEKKNIFELPLGQYATSYSTGMKKKLAIMAVILQENAYYILYEPYNGLDLQSSIVLTEIILKLKQLGKTVLISSHIFATLRDCCDEILWLVEGQFQPNIPKADFDAFENTLKEHILVQDIDHIFE